jgi:hypothetical protein
MEPWKYIDMPQDWSIEGVMVINFTFNNILVIINLDHDDQFYWRRKPE